MKFDLTIPQISQALSARLLIVMPIYNEEVNIRSVMNEWMPVFQASEPSFTLLALNDGSRDSTATELDALEEEYGDRLCVIHKSNAGHGLSCRLGYEIAVASSAEWVFQIDSDGQCDPAYFAEFWDVRGDADCLFGFRSTRDDGLSRLLISRICTAATFLATGNNLKDANVPYRMMRREALAAALPLIPPDFDILNVALTLVLKRSGRWRWKHIPIHFRARQGGQNSINIPKVLRMGSSMLFDLRRIGKE